MNTPLREVVADALPELQKRLRAEAEFWETAYVAAAGPRRCARVHALLREAADVVGRPSDSVIGEAFLAVLRDPSVNWESNAEAWAFIDRVADAATQPSASPGVEEILIDLRAAASIGRALTLAEVDDIAAALRHPAVHGDSGRVVDMSQFSLALMKFGIKLTIDALEETDPVRTKALKDLSEQVDALVKIADANPILYTAPTAAQPKGEDVGRLKAAEQAAETMGYASIMDALDDLADYRTATTPTTGQQEADARDAARLAQAWDDARNSGTNWNLYTAEDFMDDVMKRARAIDAASEAAK